MPTQAQITSVEAIESFRAKFIVFLGQARPVLEEASAELARTRLWLQGEQRMFWEQQLRLRGRRLEEAKQELFNARFADLHGAAALHQMTVQRAQRAVQEAEAKLVVLKKWDRELENRAAPLMKQTDQLRGFFATDLARAVAYLDQVLKALAAYRSVPAPRPAAVTAKPEEGK